MTGTSYFSSLATKLAAATTLILLVVSLVVYYVLAEHERYEHLRLKHETAVATTTLFGELISTQIESADQAEIDRSLGCLRSNPEVLQAAVFPLLPGGGLGPALGTFARPQLKLPPLRAPPREGVGIARWQPNAVEVSQWVVDSTGRRIAVALVCFSLAQEHEELASLRVHALVTSISIAAVLTGLLFLLARLHIIAPLRAVRAAISDLTTAASDRSRQLPLAAQDEIGDLARGFASMAEAIRKREWAIAEQNEQMRLVLGNVGQGFLVVDASGVIGGQHSAVLEDWFGPVLTGQTLWQYLGPHDAELNEWLELTWSNIGSMPLELCLEQLPKAARTGERHYQIHYHPVRGAGSVLEKMVVVIDDVTTLRRREEGERGQRDLVDTVMAVLRDRTGFISLCEEAEALIAELSAGESNAEQLERLHTLKGNAQLFKLLQLAAACERLERESRLLNRSDATQLSHAYASSIGPLASFVEQRREEAVQLSGRDFAALVEAIQSGASSQEVLAQLARATSEPAEDVFARFSERLQVLARRLGKCPVIVSCDGGGVSFPKQTFAPLWAAVVHVLRNIADHGLETSWEREQRGKPACAEVTLKARTANGCIHISFSDDGRGIDWERVRAQAAERGLPHITRGDLTAALFARGFSTADKEMTLSGRGVGLSALASEAQALGGTVSVESELGRGTKVSITLPSLERRESMTRRLVG